MVELPERLAQVQQAEALLKGKRVVEVVAAHTPHGFAQYTGDPGDYPARLLGKQVQAAYLRQGELRIHIGDLDLLITTPMRYHAPGAKLPATHQLMLGFEDGAHLTCSVAMWGSMLLLAHEGGADEEPDWLLEAERRPYVTPLDETFTLTHLRGLMPSEGKSLSVKGLLATEQRIPGIGNGVIQDILYTAGLLPMRDCRTLSEQEWEGLHRATREVVAQMVAQGGRDTEKDLLGRPGGYRTILSRKTADAPCPKCGGRIERKAYMGGNVYFCPACQR